MRKKHGRKNARAQCRKKTARGNSYSSRAEAERRADWLAQVSGDPVHAFRCPLCQRWHTGKRSNHQPR